MEHQASYNVNQSDQDSPVQPGNWVIIQLMGHKVMAGYATKEEPFGLPMIRLDVPDTDKYPAWTTHISPQAVYAISYVSESAARSTAQAAAADPIPIYVPDIDDTRAYRQEVERLRDELSRALPAPNLPPEPEVEDEDVFFSSDEDDWDEWVD